ncbi:MAG: DUF554 domain-containing protein [Clostridiales bacterium]|jgi:uncharacterized membrane protein YqgA involved in biofilm formation|nr:DUF554 domain-containing protein [Clostridiales bacterium]
MVASIVNAAAIFAGGAIGLLFKKWVNEKHSRELLKVIGLITVVIGVTYAVKTDNFLVLIVCLVLGTLAGELLRLDDRLESLGARAFKAGRSAKGEQLAQSFIASSLLFGVGSMAIVGSMRAGIEGDFSIIYTKSLMDGISAITFAVAMGPGVLFSGFVILIYQGGLTLLFQLASASLDTQAVAYMSAIGGVIMLSIGANMAGFAKERLKSANMLPALILPFLWFAALKLI